jgi:hypothetical protein
MTHRRIPSSSFRLEHSAQAERLEKLAPPGADRSVQGLPSWALLAGYLPSSEEEATHLVVGQGEILLGKSGYGILAYCSDQLSAYRCAREIRKDPTAEVMVLPNSFKLRCQVTLILQDMLRENQSGSQDLTQGAP